MIYPRLIIPKINEIEKLYIYRSINANDINTITKVSKLEPVIVIDQSLAEVTNINKHDCYILHDLQENLPGITYNGPNVNTVPINEYETKINIIKLNTYTFINELVLKPLELNHKEGTIYYYSVIGVNESTNSISHLSRVTGSLFEYTQSIDMTRQIWSCDNYTGKDTDIWTLVNTIEYDETTEDIKIGNIKRSSSIEKLGLPFIETVPKIKEINVGLQSLVSNTFMLLQVENPWRDNNKDFNTRKLKSYKIRNVYGSTYGEFSYPTYQSELPVSIEKMIIMYKENPLYDEQVINIDDDTAKKIEIIRYDGIFYNPTEHKIYGRNPWIIPLENNDFAVFSETSIQETINIQISAVMGNVYVFDIYLIDVYENMSDNTHYILNT